MAIIAAVSSKSSPVPLLLPNVSIILDPAKPDGFSVTWSSWWLILFWVLIALGYRASLGSHWLCLASHWFHVWATSCYLKSALYSWRTVAMIIIFISFQGTDINLEILNNSFSIKDFKYHILVVNFPIPRFTSTFTKTRGPSHWWGRPPQSQHWGWAMHHHSQTS